MEENKRLKNEFRDTEQLLEVSEDELMLRDQIIIARAMESNHILALINRHALKLSLAELVSLQAFMQRQPVSPGLTALTGAATIQVEAAKKALEPPAVARADLVQLAALRAAISLAEAGDGTQASRSIPIQDIRTPIEDDGLPEDNMYDGHDNEEDTEREEEIEMVDPNEVPVKL